MPNSDDDYYMHLYRCVMQYSGMNFKEVEALSCDVFMLMYKSSIIEELLQMPEGKGVELLRDSCRLQQTEPDIEKLYKVFGGGTNDGA